MMPEEKINVLLVDDVPDKLLALEALLADESLNLVKAQSGMEALRLLLGMDFALILLDVRMPVLDGFETAELIRKRLRSEHTPIIFITAYGADEALLGRGYALGAVDYIYGSPLVPEILRAKVAGFVELHRVKRELRKANASLETKVRERTAALEESLLEKEVLLREIHHRVKNNLQIISSLLSLQTGRSGDPEVAGLLQDSRNRIRTMALVHEKLYASSDLARIGFPGYIRELSEGLFRSHDAAARGVDLRVEVDDMETSINIAIPCGLIVHEMVSNALKHAFAPGTPSPGARVEIRCRRAGEGFELAVRDNGGGMAAGKEDGSGPSLGMQLIRTLVKQLDGTLDVSRNGGTEFKVRIPRTESAGEEHVKTANHGG